ncbi:MAG: protein-(glutamine-N5) methyltransferase, release factor-specific [Elusimicrobia bacterium RIFOXYB2_FULL_62_6]|nr:MAG: protein-(glutamine-N5) methyltransferase, release factor-specific [Elusimicrobia bacterium RIFOXYB2_FULL_62_6]
MLAEGEALLAAAGISEAKLNCGWLLAHLLKTDRLSLLADRCALVPAETAADFKRLLARKAAGEPLAYILGSQPFCGLSLKVDARVLVPRPETEELVGLAADFILKHYRSGAPELLDFGAGSGNIALALAARFPKALVTAAEKSREALACAKENAAACGLEGRVKFVRASSLKGVKGPFDVIVSNPPYIPTGIIGGLDKEVLSEPFLALDGGRDGLKIVRAIAALAPRALKKGGALFLELGDRQAGAALALFSGRPWRKSGLFKDLCGKKRFVFAEKK